MEQQGFFDPKGLNLKRENVYFESTREEKVARIGFLKCTHFIDDLEETFDEPDVAARGPDRRAVQYL